MLRLVVSDSHAALHDVGVNLSDAIDGVRADHAQVSHVDPLGLALLDQRHPPQTICVTRKHGRYPLRHSTHTSAEYLHTDKHGRRRRSYVQVSLVDVVDDQQVSRQQLLEHEHRPALQRLRQHRVVGVRTRTTGDVPRLRAHTHTHTHFTAVIAEILQHKILHYNRIRHLVPVQLLDVHQDPHQFRDRQSRVGVVQLDRHLTDRKESAPPQKKSQHHHRRRVSTTTEEE